MRFLFHAPIVWSAQPLATSMDGQGNNGVSKCITRILSLDFTVKGLIDA